MIKGDQLYVYINISKTFQENYGMKHFPTSKADQNPLESEFGVYRGMDGSNVDPNALELGWRISRSIIDRALRDPEIDIDAMKEPLLNYLRTLVEEEDILEDLGNEFDPDFDYNSVPIDIREEVVMAVDEDGTIHPTVKLRMQDEVDGLIWVCVSYSRCKNLIGTVQFF